MKKSLVALAALAVAGVASAQSSVTLFGILDAAVSNYSNKSEDRNSATLLNPFYINRGTATASRTALSNSGYNSSRLGFRGTEDLGGGLAASFWLEGAINNDDGTGTSNGAQNWQRRSTVSLSGGFGEVRLGRDYVPTFWNDTVFDPFGTNGVGTNLIMTANNNLGTTGPAAIGFAANNNYVRASNSIGYFLPPNLGGFYGQLMYSFNEQNKYDPGTLTPNVANNSRAGRWLGGRVGYANGPLDVALAYGDSTVADAYYAGLTAQQKIWNLGGSYDFGPVKLFGEYSHTKQSVDNSGLAFLTNVEPSLKGWLLGATVPVGPGLIRFAYSNVKYDRNLTIPTFLTTGDPKADKWALGYVHNLSKRTALYATVARINNKNGADLTVGGPAFVSTIPANGLLNAATLTPKSSTGYDFGIRHAF